MNSRFILLLTIAVLGASPLLTVLAPPVHGGMIDNMIPDPTIDFPELDDIIPASGDPDGNLRIDLDYPPARYSSGLYGSEIVMDDVEMDPVPGSMRIPRDVLDCRLPLGAVIDDISLRSDVVDLLGPDPGISRSDPPRPTNYIEIWDGIEERPDPPGEHLTWDMGTGIDAETDERSAFLSIVIYPVIPHRDRFRALRSGTIDIRYHVEKPVPGMEVSPLLDEEYDLLVLCREDFRGTMENYSHYRNLTGTITKVVTLEEIESGSIWQVEGRDIQERIKRFVYNATLFWNIEFLLLVGDADRFPVRHIMVLDGSDDNGASRVDGRFVPSDLYYSDVFEGGGTDFSSWNGPGGDSELLWGEFDSTAKDDPDLYPDLYVGRMPASDRDELENMIDKIQGYERSARGSDWFYNATLCGTDTFSGGTPEGEYTSDIIGNNYLSGFNLTKHYQTKGTLSGIASTVDEGCGFFEMSDHGTYTNWAGAYYRTHAYNQKNGYMLPVVVMDACLTHGFDNENASSSTTGKDPVFDQFYYAPGESSSGTECVGEQTHRAPAGGSIASFGCTRIGWGAVGASYPNALSGFMNVRIHRSYSEGMVRPGQLLARAVTDYRSSLGMGSASGYKTMTEYILLGDPSVYLGGISSTSVEIVPEVDEIWAEPGKVLSINYTLRNVGLLPAPFNMTVASSGISTHPFTASLNRTDYVLMPNGTSSGTVTITFPEDGLFMEEDEVVLSASSILFNKPRKASVRVVVDRVSDVSVEPYPSPIICDSGASLTGNLRINNQGNSRDTFTISIDDLPDGWTMTLGKDSVEVDALDYERIHFMLNVSVKAQAGSYHIRAGVNSSIGYAVNSSIMKVDVRPAYDLSIEVENETLEVMPETAGYYDVTLKNDGNSRVNVSLDLTPHDADLFMITGPASELAIDPFSSMNIPMKVVPVNGTEPRSYPLTLRAANGNSSDEMILTTVVLPAYIYRTSCIGTERVLGDSLDVSFTVRIDNIGNIRDSYLISCIPNNNWTWEDHGADTIVKIEPGDSANTSLYLSTRDLPLQGSYGFRLRIETTSGIGYQEIPVTVIVRAHFDHSISVDMLNETVYPADSADGELMVNSSANGNDIYMISGVVPEGWSIQFGSARLEASPFQVLPVNFSITAADDALAGKYMIDLHVYSTGSNSSKTFRIPIFVREVYRISWDIIGFDEGSALDPGSTANISIHIFNGGNVRDRVMITLRSWAVNWMSLKDSAFFVEPGSNFTTQITIRVPVNATPAAFSLGIRIDSLGSEGSVRNITLEVSDPEGSNNGVMPWYSFVLIVLIAVLMLLILGGVLYANFLKHRGVNVEDAGMEWSEDDEDEWDE